MSLFEYKDTDDRALQDEMAKSDRFRAGFLGVVFFTMATAAVVVVSTRLWQYGGPALAFFDRVPFAVAIPAVALVGLYEFVYRFLVGRLLAAGRRFPLPPRLFSTTLEISVPTLLTVLIAQAVPGSEALALPTVFVYFPFLALAPLRLDPPLVLYAGLLAGAEFVVMAWFLLGGGGPVAMGVLAPQIAKAVLMALTGVLLTLVTWQIRKRAAGLLRTREQQARMASIFGQHVSPAVMERLLAQKAGLETEVRHVTVMFLDIRNFTTFSESRTPDEVVAYLNRLFAFMVDEVNAHQGIINKFLGDGFMAVFGAPLDDGHSEANAVHAAVAISDGLRKALAEGLEPTKIGIGLHSGRAVTGNVGSQQRQEYTLIGDVVNLASRIESQTKAAGAEILISAEAWAAAGRHGAEGLPEGQAIGPVTVKGRAAPVELVRLR
jgi:adenylate cyclase